MSSALHENYERSFGMGNLVLSSILKKEYIWLSRLGKNLKLKEDIEPLVRAYKGNETDPLYQAVMDLIIRANWEKYEEVREMCEALRELFADELVEREERGLESGIKRGTMLKLISMVRKKVEKGLSAAEIAELLEEEVEMVNKIYDAIQEHTGYTDGEVYELCFA